MGVYYYTLGKSGRTKAAVNGETQTLFPMAYRWKFYGSTFGSLGRTQDRVIASLDSKARKAFAHPEFSGLVFVGEKPVEGEPVYKLNPGVISWIDTGDLPGTVIGRLKKDGRSWQVVPVEEMPSNKEVENFWKNNGYSTSHANCYYTVKVPFTLPCHAVLNLKNGEFVSGYTHPLTVLDTSKVHLALEEGFREIYKACLRNINDQLEDNVTVYLSPYNGVTVQANRKHSLSTAAN